MVHAMAPIRLTELTEPTLPADQAAVPPSVEPGWGCHGSDWRGIIGWAESAGSTVGRLLVGREWQEAGPRHSMIRASEKGSGWVFVSVLILSSFRARVNGKKQPAACANACCRPSNGRRYDEN